MARRNAATKRQKLPDPLFVSTDISKFMNVIMSRGKKSIAESIVYNALDELFDRSKGKFKDEMPHVDNDGVIAQKKAKLRGGIMSSASARKLALELFTKALDAVKPAVEVRSRRVGGANYQVPVEVKADRKMALAMRWIVKAAKARKEKSMASRLANELLDILDGKGAAIKTRDDMHKMAKANQAFAHYRW